VMRQTEITTELMDIIIGFEALKKDKKTAAAADSSAGEGQALPPFGA